jgi:hypothetical protein
MIECPCCQTIIEDESRIDKVSVAYFATNAHFGVKDKKIMMKKRGFDYFDFFPVCANVEICPFCGIIFVPGIIEVMKKGIKKDSNVNVA